MATNFPEPADRRSTLSTRKVSTGRTGLILGAVVVLLMLATFAYFWSRGGSGETDEGERTSIPDSLP
jgi:hypothetical protein